MVASDPRDQRAECSCCSPGRLLTPSRVESLELPPVLLVVVRGGNCLQLIRSEGVRKALVVQTAAAQRAVLGNGDRRAFVHVELRKVEHGRLRSSPTFTADTDTQVRRRR